MKSQQKDVDSFTTADIFEECQRIILRRATKRNGGKCVAHLTHYRHYSPKWMPCHGCWKQIHLIWGTCFAIYDIK